MLDERSRELMRMADHLEDMGKYFNRNWAVFEAEFFEILLSSGYRPKIVKLTGKKEHYFTIDYSNRKLIEAEKQQVLCEIEALAAFGKSIASDEPEPGVTENAPTGDERTEDGDGHSNYAVE